MEMSIVSSYKRKKTLKCILNSLENTELCQNMAYFSEFKKTPSPHLPSSLSRHFPYPCLTAYCKCIWLSVNTSKSHKYTFKSTKVKI